MIQTPQANYEPAEIVAAILLTRVQCLLMGEGRSTKGSALYAYALGGAALD